MVLTRAQARASAASGPAGNGSDSEAPTKTPKTARSLSPDSGRPAKQRKVDGTEVPANVLDLGKILMDQLGATVKQSEERAGLLAATEAKVEEMTEKAKTAESKRIEAEMDAGMAKIRAIVAEENGEARAKAAEARWAKVAENNEVEAKAKLSALEKEKETLESEKKKVEEAKKKSDEAKKKAEEAKKKADEAKKTAQTKEAAAVAAGKISDEKLKQAQKELEASHWQIACEIPRLNNLSTYKLTPLPRSSPVFKLLQKRVQTSCARHRREQGSDIWHDAAKIEITSIEKIQNPRLIQQYQTGVDRVVGKWRTEFPDMPEDLEEWKVPLAIGAKNLNEIIGFHGTDRDRIRKIAKGGLDPQRTDVGMFGRGSYLAPNFSKSDQYDDVWKDVLRGRLRKRSVLLVRAILGKYHTQKVGCRSRQLPPDGPNDLALDSIFAPGAPDGAVDLPEVVIFKENQLLPLYIINYRHAQACECHMCHRRSEDADSDEESEESDGSEDDDAQIE